MVYFIFVRSNRSNAVAVAFRLHCWLLTYCSYSWVIAVSTVMSDLLKRPVLWHSREAWCTRIHTVAIRRHDVCL